jgi:hypothetical protein
MSTEFFVYLLECTDQSTYVGATVDLEHRLRQHNGEIKGGAHATTMKVRQGLSWKRVCYVSGFPDWTYWINTWSIKFEDNLGILTWTGGTGKYIVTIAGKGIVCETLSGVKSCKFGPLDSDTLYTGTITAQNTPVSLSRTANLSFTTGKLVGALEQYALDQAAALKLVREKADIEKADSFIATLSKQISSATLLEAQAEASFLKSSKETDKYLETLATNDLIVKNTQDEIKKMTNVLKNLVLKILKKSNDIIK